MLAPQNPARNLVINRVAMFWARALPRQNAANGRYVMRKIGRLPYISLSGAQIRGPPANYDARLATVITLHCGLLTPSTNKVTPNTMISRLTSNLATRAAVAPV
jgi:hypothetical protein